MIFQGKAVLVYLEEDNIARAYFRIQPLLTSDGPVSQEELALLPDEGFLRIVPDRNEQHTFKERMRTMCGLCLLDLRNQPAEANKIRTNKNYSPSHGENNQYIVYSDAVRAIEPNLLYQVVSQADAEKAITPTVYIRNGANMQGPVAKDHAQLPDDAKQLPPDSQGLHSISVNGQELLFYWPTPAKADMVPAAEVSEAKEAVTEPVKAEANKPEHSEQIPDAKQTALDQIQQMNAACITNTANKLTDKPAAPVFVPQQQPLNGTKLYTPVQRSNNARRAHNALMETVEFQRYASKTEAPGAVVSDSAALKAVQNPVESFKRTLQSVCMNAEDCRQAVNIFLECPGMRQAVTDVITKDNKDLTTAAMNEQLHEMEAERLMLLMQLDDAKKEMASLKKEALEEAAASEKADLEQLSKRKKAMEAELKAQESALIHLNEQREEAENTLEKAANDGNTVLLMRPIGSTISENALIDRLEKNMKSAGFVCEKGDALSLLTALAISPQALLVEAASDADAAYAVQTLAQVFGSPVSMNINENRILLAPGGNTPVFVRTRMQKGCTAILLPSDSANRSALPMHTPFALLCFKADQNAIPTSQEFCGPVSADALCTFLKESPLSEETLNVIHSLRVVQSDMPLPLARVSDALRFISATQNILPGGVAEAIDRAVSMFILPHYLFSGMKKDMLSPLLASLPRSSEIWNKKK